MSEDSKFENCVDFIDQVIPETDILASFPVNEIMSAATQGYRYVEDYHWMLGNMIESFRALGYRWVAGIKMYEAIEKAREAGHPLSLDQVAELWIPRVR